jgi:hypothetical protein
VGVIGVVATLLGVATEVKNLKTFGCEIAREKLFQVVACVVASDTYLVHIVVF